jgi:hypothetical protein
LIVYGFDVLSRIVTVTRQTVSEATVWQFKLFTVTSSGCIRPESFILLIEPVFVNQFAEGSGHLAAGAIFGIDTESDGC